MDVRILSEQQAYYEARAPEYDEWFCRLGRYDRGPEATRQWNNAVATVRQKLRSLSPLGEVVELACGTGIWTEELLKYADHVTAIDGSAAMIAQCRDRVGTNRVSLVQADLFSWQPERRFDFVFFGFWLSHVPWSHFDRFWDTVRQALSPEGRVFFVDSARDPESTAANHVLPQSDCEVAERKLNDGTKHRIVKIFHEPADLQERLERLGWTANIARTGRFFICGTAQSKV